MPGNSEQFGGKCNMIRYIKLVISAKDVSGGM